MSHTEIKSFIENNVGKLTYYEMSKKTGLNTDQVKYWARKLGLQNKRTGPTLKPFLEQKVTIQICVKRKHYAEAFASAKEHLKQYR